METKTVGTQRGRAPFLEKTKGLTQSTGKAASGLRVILKQATLETVVLTEATGVKRIGSGPLDFHSLAWPKEDLSCGSYEVSPSSPYVPTASHSPSTGCRPSRFKLETWFGDLPPGLQHRRPFHNQSTAVNKITAEYLQSHFFSPAWYRLG